MNTDGTTNQKAGTKLLRIAVSFVLAFSMVPIAPAAAFADDGSGLAAASLQNASGGGLTALDESDVWDGSIDTSWYKAGDKEFTLTTAAQLAGLAAIVNGTASGLSADTFNGKTVTLGADIMLNATAAGDASASGQRQWAGIGAGPLIDFYEGMPNFDETVYFDGTFDGAGHVVKNIFINKPSETAKSGETASTFGGYQGLFGALGGNATVKNVGLVGGFIYGRAAGGIAALSHASATEVPHIIGCFNTATVQGNGASTRGTGGIFGGEEQYRSRDEGDIYRAGAYIANCYNTGEIKGNAGSPHGGIAGAGSVKIFSCFNTGKVTSWSATGTDEASTYAGAIAGNLIGAGAMLGDGKSKVEGSAVVRNSYALSGTIGSDANGKTKLFNLIDATHTKDGKGDADAAVEEADSVEFEEADWFAGEEPTLALSHSFIAGEAIPALWWESGNVADIRELDASDSEGALFGIYKIDDQPYTGSAVEPEVRVWGYDADVNDYYDLVAGGDFAVSYSNNVNAGTATATVTGIGRFTKSLSKTFKVVDGNLATAVIAPVNGQWWYGSGEVTPALSVKSSVGTTLREGHDFEVSYADNDKPGTATATISAVEGTAFSGSQSVSFEIVEASGSLAGAGTEESPWELSSKADLQFAAHQVNANEDEAYIKGHYKVTEDFDAGATEESPLAADPIGEFAGTIDGGGHTITLGLRWRDNDDHSMSGDIKRLSALAFVMQADDGATFKNLMMDGTVESAAPAAAFAGTTDETGTVTFENCVNKARVQGDTYTAGLAGAAGFLCQVNVKLLYGYTYQDGAEAVFERCENLGQISSAEAAAAGFVLTVKGKGASFADCSNKADVTSGRLNGAAGIISALEGKSSATEVSLVNCSNTGAVTSVDNGCAGGLIAYEQSGHKALTVSKCFNAGTIDGVNDAGGLIGKLAGPATITDCYNTGAIRSHIGNGGSWSGNRAPGGLIGECGMTGNSDKLAVTNFYNAGDTMAIPDTDAPNNFGLIGQFYYSGTVTFDNVYYAGDLASSACNLNRFSSVKVSGDPLGLSSEAMKSAMFVNLLGTEFSADAAGVNGGFPVLGQREVKSLEDCKIADIPAQKYTGAEVRPAVTVTAPKDAGSSDDPDSEGEELAEGTDYLVFYDVSGGKGQVTVVGQGDWTGMLTADFDIEKCPITSCAISPLQDKSYGDNVGGRFTQDITVTNPAGGALVEGVDYTVVYSGNDRAGTVVALIKGKGDFYQGTAIRLFTIAKGDLAQIAELTGVSESYAFSWSGASVYESVVLADGTKLARGTDYTRTFVGADGTEYANASDFASMPGTYRVVLVGKGNWTGELSASFVYGYQVSVNGAIDGVEPVYKWTGEPVGAAPVLKRIYNYYGRIYYYDVDEDAYTVKVTDEDGVEQDAAKIADPGVYTVTVTGKGDSGGWIGTGSVTFEIVAPEFFIDGDAVAPISMPYAATGSAVAVNPQVTVAGKTLVKGVNYSVTFTDASGNEVAAPVEVGKYTMTIAGIAPYAGTVEREIEVVEKGAQAITASNITKTVGDTFTLAAKTSGDGALTFTSGNAKVATVDKATGKVTAKAKGTAKITIAAAETATFAGATKTITLTVKAANPFKFTGNSVSTTVAKAKKGNVVLAGGKFSGNKADVMSYAASKFGNAVAKKWLTVDKKNGKVTVKKGAPAGTYKVTVKATAKARGSYGETSKTAVVTVTVKK